MLGRAKKISVYAGLILGLVVLTLAGAAWFVHSDRARQYMIATVSRQIPGTVRWDSQRISLLTGALTLTGLEIRSPGGQRLATADRLAVHWAWRPLLEKRIVIDSLDLKNPWFDIRRLPDGRLNAVAAVVDPERRPSPPTKKPAPAVTVRSLTLSKGQLRYHDPSTAISVQLSDIDIKADGDALARQGRLDITAGALRLESRTAAADLAPVTLRGELTADRIEKLVVRARMGKTELCLTGGVDHLRDAPRVDLTLDTSADLTGITAVFAALPAATGRAVIHLKVAGAAGNPAVRGTIGYGGGTVAGQRIRAASARFKMIDRRLILADTALDLPAGHLALTGEVDLRPVFPRGWLDPAPKTDAIQYDLALHLRDGRLAALPRVGDGVRGRVQSDLTFRGTGLSPARLAGQGRLTIRGPVRLTAAPDLPVTLDTSAGFHINNGRVKIDRWFLTTGFARLDAQGACGLAGGDLTGRISLDVPRMDRLSSLAVSAHPSGAVRLDARITGSIFHPRIIADLTGRQMRVGRVALGDVRLTAALDSYRHLTVSDLVIENKGARITGTGGLRLEKDGWAVDATAPLDLSLTVTDAAIPDFWADSDAAGTVSGRVTLSGSLDQPAGVARMTGKNVRIPGFQPLDLTVALALADGAVSTTAPLLLAWGKSTVQIQGRAAVMDPVSGHWYADPRLTVDGSGQGVQLADIVPDDAGIIDLTFNLNGAVSALSGTYRAAGRRLVVRGQAVPDARLSGRLTPGKIVVETARIALTPKDVVSADGWYGFDRTFAFRAATRGIDLAGMDIIGKKMGLTGRATFTFTGRGRLDAPRIQGTVALTRLAAAGSTLADIHLAGHLADNRFAITGRQTGAVVNTAGRLSDGSFTGNLVLDAVALGPYFAWQGQPDLTGRISGTLTFHGNIHDLERIDLTGNITDLAMRFKQTGRIRADAFCVRIHDGALILPGLTCRLPETGTLTLRGRVARSGPVRLTVDGDIPLETISPFADFLTGVTGRARLAGRLSGTFDAPVLTATVDLVKAAWPIPGSRQTARDINGRIRLSPRAIAIEQLHGRIGTGRVVMTGTAGLDRFRPVSTDVHLTATSVPLAVPDTADLVFDADLTLRGPWKASRLGGAVTLIEGTYYQDLHLNLLDELSAVTRKKRTIAPAPARRINPFLDPFLNHLALHVDIRHRQLLQVDNDLASLDVAPDLTVAGTFNRPVLTGRVDLVSGRIRFEQRKFTLQKGSIAFLNPYKTEPSFNLAGTGRIRRWDVALAVTGTMDALNVDLTSRPPLTRDDIVSLLVLGKTSSELIDGDGGHSRTNAQRLADLAASALGNDIRRTAGLDLLEVSTADDANGETGETGTGRASDTTGTAGQVKVTIGKNLSRRLAVKYSVAAGNGELIQRTDAEYRLRDHLLVSGFQGSDGVYGGKFVFRMEFR